MAKWVIKTAADYAAAHKGIQDKIDKVTEGINSATIKAVIDIALDWIGRAVERAPVETGDLRGSAYVKINGTLVAKGNEDGSITVLGSPSIPTDGRMTITVEIGFTSPYAFVQHEHVEFEHPLGGEAKYLESVIVEGSAAARQYLIDSAKKAFGGDV